MNSGTNVLPRQPTVSPSIFTTSTITTELSHRSTCSPRLSPLLCPSTMPSFRVSGPCAHPRRARRFLRRTTWILRSSRSTSSTVQVSMHSPRRVANQIPNITQFSTFSTLPPVTSASTRTASALSVSPRSTVTVRSPVTPSSGVSPRSASCPTPTPRIPPTGTRRIS